MVDFLVNSFIGEVKIQKEKCKNQKNGLAFSTD